MALLEAMQKFLNTSFPLLHPQLSEEERKQALQTLQVLRQADKILSQGILYEILSPEEGRVLAHQALVLSQKEDVDEEFEFTPHQILANIADAVSGALTGLYPHLLSQDFSYGKESLFREADAETRDQLLAWVENEEKTVYFRDQLLSFLAWIDDEVIVAAFRRWRDNPQPWGWNLPQLVEQFTAVAGWELTADGQRRTLYFPICYSLVPSPKTLSEQETEPVAMVVAHEGHCGWCQRSLVTLFDLLLHNPRLHFLSLRGERLRIAICPNCSPQDRQIVTDVDFRGGSRWSLLNGNPPKRLRFMADETLEKMAFPTHPLVLGPQRRTPFLSAESHLGGCPEWVQYPEYPQCSQCQRTMIFLVQYEPKGVHYIEGIFYAFLCIDCQKATTVYQQT